MITILHIFLDILQESHYPTEHLSDILRYVTLWKYGGTYLDLDVITLKSFEEVEENFVGIEYDKSVGAGIINFSRKRKKSHKWTRKILNYLNANFLPECWSDNSVGVLVKLV